MAYLEAQARVMGLKPANGTSFRQEVHIIGTALKTAESNLLIG